MKRLLALLTAVTVSVCGVCTAYAANTRSYSYAYDAWAVPNATVSAFEVTRELSEKNSLESVTVQSVDDVHAGGGRLFIVDSVASRVNVLDENFEYVASIKLLRGQDGKIALNEAGEQITLMNPEGVFFYALKNEIYIADTGKERVVVLDGDTYRLKREILRPSGMTGVTAFKPSKVAVDAAGRIYIVVQAGFEGMIELTEDGEFSRYFGVNKPAVNLIDFFWKQFATNEQRAKMEKTFAPSFNSVDVDPDGFIYSTSTDLRAKPIFRLNPKGENVLLANEKPVIGDYIYQGGVSVTTFIDVAVNEYGVYAALDRTYGRIFIYNFYGEMITVINNPSGMKGGLKTPSAICWFGDRLIVSDKDLKKAYVYETTEFGALAMSAAKNYYEGKWAESAALLEEAVKLNGNYDYAYSGIGKYYLMQDDYEKAMYYLKLGQDRAYYSKAFNAWRNEWVKNNFWWMAVLFAVGAAALVWSEVKHNRKSEAK